MLTTVVPSQYYVWHWFFLYLINGCKLVHQFNFRMLAFQENVVVFSLKSLHNAQIARHCSLSGLAVCQQYFAMTYIAFSIMFES